MRAKYLSCLLAAALGNATLGNVTLCNVTQGGDGDRGGDELFSQLAMESVFEKGASTAPVDPVAKPSENREILRVTGVSSLLPMLKGADLKPTVEGNQIAIKFEHSGWVFPVTLRVDIEREQILCDLSLIKIEKQETIDRDAMLQLMAAGDPSQSAFFAFDSEEKLLRLRATLSNRNVTASGFLLELERLARLADRQSKLWSNLGIAPKAGKTTETSPANTTTPTTNGNRPAFSLDGRWSASSSKGDGFAVLFDQKSRFSLVHVKAGKSTKSTGKVTSTANQLVLQGDDGTKLTCTVAWRDAKGFQLSILDAKGNVTVRLDFKKQS